MKFSRIMQVAAVGVALLALAGTETRADYSYTTLITLTDAPVVGPGSPVSRSFGTGSTLTMTGISQSGLNGSQGINIANVQLSSTTVAPPTDTASIAYSIDVNITNPDPGGSTGTLTVTGVLNFLRSDTGGQLSTNLFTSGVTTATIGDTIFAINPAIGGAYAQPTVNTTPGNGNISVILTAVPVPEPASMALLGLGTVGLGVVFRRRMARARA